MLIHFRKWKKRESISILFKEDLRSLTEEKFHITLLTLPVLGVVIFTLIPILLLIFVAFTNYDQQHMPPTELFSWVGLSNFINLFGGGGLTSTFGYAFVRVLGWTLVWAFFATFTTYIGGILLSLLLNRQKNKTAENVAYFIYCNYCSSTVCVTSAGA